jgi:squalene-hopene/tetraprenyl-beta-curcumene cyclase
MNQEGYWTGRLSGSALATAVAIVALKKAIPEESGPGIRSGYNWLLKNINNDGGFGDTSESVSNVSTTLLCYSAISYCQVNGNGISTLTRMEGWLSGIGITFEPRNITRSILKFYGKDLTFSVPILSMLHLAGVIPSSSLKEIPGLPFELTLLPRSLYSFFNLRVVSYALPALIGVGIYLHTQRERGTFSLRSFRNIFIKPAIRRLNSLVPESGGILEAIPLTGFVSMCLVASGNADNLIVQKGTDFLCRQQRDDGSWPIDTDLSTWVTTLSVKAFGNDVNKYLSETQRNILREHLLGLQYTKIHPFNGAKPGGWGWTSYFGSVPDADDTPGAILALHELYAATEREKDAIINGCMWLIGLQNSDGGFPTFCKGWGRLPFDRSCADLTGHALLALIKTVNIFGNSIGRKSKSEIEKSILKATVYLEKQQGADGSWVPLWFGNQQTDDQTNPVYGTAKVCIYLNDCLKLENVDKSLLTRLAGMVENAQVYLISQQNSDGNWGGKKGVEGTIEETSLAICALAPKLNDSCSNGIAWLENQKNILSSPIGLYFALLWYDEKLYPYIYMTEAYRRLLV